MEGDEDRKNTERRRRNDLIENKTDQIIDNKIEEDRLELLENTRARIGSEHIKYLLGIIHNIQHNTQLRSTDDLKTEIQGLSDALYDKRNEKLGINALAAVLDSASTILRYLSSKKVDINRVKIRLNANTNIIRENEAYAYITTKRLLKYFCILIGTTSPIGFSIYNYWNEFYKSIGNIMNVYTSFGISTTAASLYFTLNLPTIVRQFIDVGNSGSFFDSINLILSHYGSELITSSSYNNQSLSLLVNNSKGLLGTEVVLYQPDNTSGLFNMIIRGLDSYARALNPLLAMMPMIEKQLHVSSLDIVTQSTTVNVGMTVGRLINTAYGGRPRNELQRTIQNINHILEDIILECQIAFRSINGVMDMFNLIIFILLFITLIHIILDIVTKVRANWLKNSREKR